MELTRIYLQNPNKYNLYPNWENQLTPRYMFDESSFKTAFETHETELLEITAEKMREFINAPVRCNDSVDMFPQRELNALNRGY